MLHRNQYFNGYSNKWNISDFRNITNLQKFKIIELKVTFNQNAKNTFLTIYMKCVSYHLNQAIPVKQIIDLCYYHQQNIRI